MEPQMSRPALLRALKRNEERGPYHILRSIVTDAAVVRLTAAHFPGLPVVGNLRTGAWYVEPEVSSAVPGAGGPTAYFKSSDGHPGAWIMPPSRLNLGFLNTVTTAGGAILVDSTRKGKRFPDSFSRTVPMWCAMLNRIARPDETAKEWHELVTPPIVSPSELSQIEKLLPSFIEGVKSSGLSLNAVQALTKPLRPVFISADTFRPDSEHCDAASLPFLPVVLLCPSRTDIPLPYVQGAADDEETWARGLTPALFWAHREEIIGSGEDGIEDRIIAVTHAARQATDAFLNDTASPSNISAVGSTRLAISFGARPSAAVMSDYGGVLDLCEVRTLPPGPHVLHLPVTNLRKGRLRIVRILPQALAWARPILASGGKLLLHSNQRIEEPAAVCMALLISFYSTEGEWQATPRRAFSKELIRRMQLVLLERCPLAHIPAPLIKELNRHYLTPADLQPSALSVDEDAP